MLSQLFVPSEVNLYARACYLREEKIVFIETETERSKVGVHNDKGKVLLNLKENWTKVLKEMGQRCRSVGGILF